MSGSAKRLETVDEIATWMHVSPSAVYELVRDRKIPFRRLPGRRTLRFDRDEVEQAMREPRAEAAAAEAGA